MSHFRGGGEPKRRQTAFAQQVEALGQVLFGQDAGFLHGLASHGGTAMESRKSLYIDIVFDQAGNACKAAAERVIFCEPTCVIKCRQGQSVQWCSPLKPRNCRFGYLRGADAALRQLLCECGGIAGAQGIVGKNMKVRLAHCAVLWRFVGTNVPLKGPKNVCNWANPSVGQDFARITLLC